MTRILLLGETPPTLMGKTKIEAAHYRTAQFLQPLLDDGHDILLVTPALASQNGSLSRHRTPYQHITLDFERPGWVSQLRDAAAAFKPECIVAVNFDFCLYATRLEGLAPIWMDIYGDPMTIMQAAAFRASSNRGLTTVAGFLRRVLEVGDVFSVCGTPQQHMLVGELAMSGRLNQHTFGYEFGRVILPGARTVEDTSPKPFPRPRPFLTSLGIPADSFVVLWAGGYNTWTDIDTLFAGLAGAMHKNPEIVFVSVGASTYGGQDQVYTRFQELVNNSEHRDRFFLLGWRPWSEMGQFYRESDIGINIDALHYETIYGTRTRLVEMIGAGLPVITSYGSEISHLLVDAGGGLSFLPGDSEQLAMQLEHLAANPNSLEPLSARALTYARDELSFEVTTRPVREWARTPQHAPDRTQQGATGRLKYIEHESRARLRWALWRLRGAYR